MDFDVFYDPARDARISRFVVASFFTPRELPQALARAFFTRDFILTTGLPLLLCGISFLLPDESASGGWWTPRKILLVIVVTWLSIAAIRLLSLGKSRAIGCTAADGTLAGGLRMKVSAASRRILLAGVVVEPSFRGQGVFTALLLAAFRLAAREREKGPVALTVFGPAHPASKHVVEKYFGGALVLPVETGPDQPFARSLAALEEEVRGLAAKDAVHRIALAERSVFDP